MPNTYSPPPTINFFGAGQTSSVIYYNSQLSSGGLNNTNSVTFTNVTTFTTDVVSVPIAGDYIVTWHCGASALSQNRIYYRIQFTNSSFVSNISGGTLSGGNTVITVASTAGFPSSGTLIIQNEEITYAAISGNTFTGCARGQNGTSSASHPNGSAVTYILLVGDTTTNLHLWSGFVAAGESWFRKVTFSVAGAWTATLQWKTDAGGTASVSGGGFYPWILLIHGTNPMDAINQQQTQYLNAGYTLMTNMDNATYWGTQTTANIINNTNNTTSNTNSIAALSSQVNTLSTNVTNLSNTVSGLTSVSVTSGGIRIKP